MGLQAEELKQYWVHKLKVECQQSDAKRESIICWLLGSDLNRFDLIDSQQLALAKQGMEYRYQILARRYLGVEPKKAYYSLTTRLLSLVLLRNKIQTWIALGYDRTSTVTEVLQEVLQNLMISDRYMQQQMIWIAQFTTDSSLRDALLFASLEEYCLRPIRNQPLVYYRFVNYLRQIQRGGLTQVPKHESLKLVADEISTEDSDKKLNLLDNHALAEYSRAQVTWEQQILRSEIKQKLSGYLAENVGPEAVKWLELYLQGKSQSAIAETLNLPIQQVYRMREKIQYHASRNLKYVA